MSKARIIEIASGLGMVLAYILLKALADKLAVDLGSLQLILEAALPMGAGAVFFKRPSDAASAEE
jgi:hypothetical protein